MLNVGPSLLYGLELTRITKEALVSAPVLWTSMEDTARQAMQRLSRHFELTTDKPDVLPPARSRHLPCSGSSSNWPKVGTLRG